MNATDWLTDAACVGEDPAIFFAEETANRYTYQDARTVCARCVVREACLEDALLSETRSTRAGFRGGLTAKERKHLACQRGVAA